MDLDEWESLSDDCYLDFKNNEDGDEKKILSSSSENVIDMNYFYPKSPTKQLIPLQIPIEPTKISNTPDDFSVKNIKRIQPLDTPSSKDGVIVEADDQEETVSQVYFKMKENEFVEMKIESPKSYSSDGIEIMSSPRRKIEKEEDEESNWEEEENNNNSGFNLWKWSFTGFGAICTFGVAAASISVLFFGNQQRKNLNHKIGFQIYTDDKRIKQVVQHATKLNEAVSALRGVPMSRAQITVGGYYDGL